MANYCYKVMFATLVLGLIAFLIVNVRQHVLAQGQLKLVRTLSGPVRGERRLGDVLAAARPYYSFRGIPYAERPTGEQRLRSPLPVRPWKAVRSCYEHAPICAQLNAKRELIGDEDCLYLNVYTPDVDPPAEQLRAVLVWLHGGDTGDWAGGSGDTDQLGPEFLMELDVLVVTVNSRLGVLGYLSLDVAEVPGNQGLADQQLALEWIQENVRLFGGDHERITLGGSGWGAEAVQLHMYSERSAPLFRSAIQMGTGWQQWQAFGRPPVGAVRAELLALVRRPAAGAVARRVHTADLLNELRAVDVVQLVEAFGPRTHQWLGPTVERSGGEFGFLQAGREYDWRLEATAEAEAEEGWRTDKAVLLGGTTAEAIAVVSASTYEHFRAINGTAGLPWRVPFKLTPEQTWQRIAERYFADGNVTRAEYVRLLSDLYQRVLVDRRARYMAGRSTGPVFRYRFALDTQLNGEKRWAGGALHREFSASVEGAAHGDELCYVFRCEALSEMYKNVTQGTEAYGQIGRMSRAVAQFVKKGEAGWEAFTTTATVERNGTETVEEAFMAIGPDEWRLEAGDFGEERRFWAELIEGLE